ncbi:MEKHLA domain-containing protein [Alkalinema sp. FACHB-956]|uniref:MEKHLA domain-containing protein n=1 Tax=Alkalinema sp. FACHB-956 TaxID=2692768 RepID=UPI0016893B6C|nr:MEKHLA domain-containing protein [Alkalinema sp. FACHB-956]MBD2327388.1 MEKHLA domain-containing protein [Alkalinema sp. FACHB-956]
MTVPSTIDPAPWQSPASLRHVQRLLNSFAQQVGRSLLANQGSPDAIAQALFEAPFVVVSHGTEADPIFNYGNQQALNLWEFDWDSFTQLPSRQSAEASEYVDREQLLAEAKLKGYISNYRGIRISRTGRRFWIDNVILWGVVDEQGAPCGQAATFDQWTFIESI